MARSYARFTVHAADDADWCALTPMAQWAYTTLLRQPKLNLAGVLDLRLRRLLPLAEGLTEAAVVAALEELEACRFIAWDRDTEEVAIRTFVKNDVNLANSKNGKGVWGAWDTIESKLLRRFVLVNLPDEAWDPKCCPRADRPVPDPVPDPPIDPTGITRSEPVDNPSVDQVNDHTTDQVMDQVTDPPPPPPPPSPSSATVVENATGRSREQTPERSAADLSELDIRRIARTVARTVPNPVDEDWLRGELRLWLAEHPDADERSAVEALARRASTTEAVHR